MKYRIAINMYIYIYSISICEKYRKSKTIFTRNCRWHSLFHINRRLHRTRTFSSYCEWCRQASPLEPFFDCCRNVYLLD